MDSVPISSVFYIGNGPAQMEAWEDAIQKLKTDEEANPQNSTIDQKDINYFQQLEVNLRQLENLAGAYRQSDNDPALAKQIRILEGRQQMLTQLIGLDTYIKSLQDNNAPGNAQKIANAEQQEQCIQQFQTVWEAYQQSGDAVDAKELNALIQNLQQLRAANPSSPYSSGPIWEDFQTVVDKYTVFEFNGQKYSVSP